MVNGSKKSRTAWTIKGLGADRPHPELKEKLMLFGQFIGDWNIIARARYPQPDGTEIKRKGEIHFGWILNGKAIRAPEIILYGLVCSSVQHAEKQICDS